MKLSKQLPVTLCLLASSISTALAQDDDIYELITTAIHTRSSETALPVTVLTADELHNAVKATLGDTLSSQPGINNASFGPAVGQTVIRGQQGRRVMNLSNSMPNADASGNSADHAQTVEAILANSIEVLRGPSTLLYGGGAIGGVVNVIDRRINSSIPKSPALAIEARHDTAADLNTVVAGLDFATDQLVWHFDGLSRRWNNLNIPGLATDSRYLDHDEDHEDEAAAENVNGFIPNTGGETTAMTAGLSWVFDSGYLGFAIAELDNQYGLPPGAHGHEEHAEESLEAEEAGHGSDFVYIDMERTRYDLNGEWRNLAPWAENVSYRLSYTDYAHAEIEGDGATGTRYSNTSLQHRLQITHTDTPERHGVLGLQHSSEEFAALGEESFIPVTDITTSGLFMVEDFHAMAGTIEIGGRVNLDTYDPANSAAPSREFTTYSLSASALWDLNQETTLGLSVSRSQRAPSVEELYSNYGLTDIETCTIHFATGSCEIGNTSFDAETSLNADLTAYVDYGWASSTITAFHNSFSDYIGQVDTGVDSGGFPVREYQQDDATFYGIEVDIRFTLNDMTTLRLFGDTIRGRFDTNGDVPRMPSNRIGTELGFAWDHWSAYINVLHANAQTRPGAFELETASWTRVDIGADYKISTASFGEIDVFLKARNIGDKEIRLPTSYLRGFAPEAGSSVETGLRVQF